MGSGFGQRGREVIVGELGGGDALIVVDMQRDFLPGGSLAVRSGDEIVATINQYIQMFSTQSLPIFFSRDWHPLKHCSFVEQGGPWPVHCVANSPGAEFAVGLTIPAKSRIVSKATRSDCDAYSAFEDTDLGNQLCALRIERVFVCGLATDYCVRATAQDAMDTGFETVCLVDAMRAVDVHRGDGEIALRTLREHGARLARLDDLQGDWDLQGD
jgi:nicotinamidase/pyrazinamidase